MIHSREAQPEEILMSKTATKPKAKTVLDVPVAFGNVSIGDGTARLTMTIDRASMNIDAADEALCGRRLTGTVWLTQDGEDKGQQMLGDDMRRSVDGVFDVKGFRVTPKAISTGLTFSLRDVDVEELSHFAKKTGRFSVTGVTSLEIEDEEESEDED